MTSIAEPVRASIVTPFRIGVAGVILGALSFWVALPPLHTRNLVAPALLAAAAGVAGGYAAWQGEVRAGWGAIVIGGLGLGLAYLAAFFCWVYTAVQLLLDKGGMRLAGYGMVLLAVAGYPAAPPLEPPAMRPTFQRLCVGPKIRLSVTPLQPNSGVFVLPRTIAPAALRRLTASASSCGTKSLAAGMPQVVGNPATL